MIKKPIEIREDPTDGYAVIRIYDADGHLFLNIHNTERWRSLSEMEGPRANAEEIVRAINNHDLLESENERLNAWRLALENLTPMGSEFVNDLPRCLEFIENKIKHGHEAKKTVVKQEREIARLKTEIERYEKMIAHENFGAISVWSYRPEYFDRELTIDRFTDGGKWTWFDEKGKVLPSAPMFDTVLEAFEAIQESQEGSK